MAGAWLWEMRYAWYIPVTWPKNGGWSWLKLGLKQQKSRLNPRKCWLSPRRIRIFQWLGTITTWLLAIINHIIIININHILTVFKLKNLRFGTTRMMISAAKIVVQPTKTGNVTDKNGHLTNKNRGLSTKNLDSTNNNGDFTINSDIDQSFLWEYHREKRWRKPHFGLANPLCGFWMVLGSDHPVVNGRFTQKMEDSRWKFLRRLRLLNGRSEEWLICLQRRYEEYGRCRIKHIHFFCHYVFFTRTFKNWWPCTGFAMKKREKNKSPGGRGSANFAQPNSWDWPVVWYERDHVMCQNRNGRWRSLTMVRPVPKKVPFTSCTRMKVHGPVTYPLPSGELT